MNGNGGGGGVPVGAFVTAAAAAERLRRAITRARWQTAGCSTTPFAAGDSPGVAGEGADHGAGGAASVPRAAPPPARLALHASPAAAGSMLDGAVLPGGLAEAVATSGAVWLPGLRVHSDRCLGGRGAGGVLKGGAAGGGVDPEALRPAAGRCGAGGAAGPGGGAFTFSELFAGVGGFRLGLD
jgi:hypothetical protein